MLGNKEVPANDGSAAIVFSNIIKTLGISNLAGTQHLEDVLLWSNFVGDVSDQNRAKIGRIRFLTYFGSAMSDIHLASGNIEKSSYKSILWIMVKLTS